VIYNGLSRQDETRLFIDINTKQRPVPNELLLDIKQLAAYETTDEALAREVFDKFDSDTASPLYGLMSPSASSEGHISRVTFNSAFKNIIGLFSERDANRIFGSVSPYLEAVGKCIDEAGLPQTSITNKTVFRAVMLLFVEAAQRVKDRHSSSDFSVDSFYDVVQPVFAKKTIRSRLRKPGSSIGKLHNELTAALRSDFSL